MYIKMPKKLPNIQNTYSYPMNNKAKAKANYNKLVASMQLLGIAPARYIQNHTPKPKPSRPRPSNSRSSITKKPRPPVGMWKGKASNGIPIGENFLKYDGTRFTVINQKALNIEKQLKKIHKLKAPAQGRNSKRLSPTLLALFRGEAPVNLSRASRNSRRGKHVQLTVR
jgi:hypothetical protein